MHRSRYSVDVNALLGCRSGVSRELSHYSLRLIIRYCQVNGTKFRSYGVAHREMIPETIHTTIHYANNRAEQSDEATRVRERGMRKFKSLKQAQRFLGTHSAVSNFFNLGRHLVSANHYRNLRMSAFTEWGRAVA